MKTLKKILAVSAALCLILSVGCGKKEESSNNITYYDDSNPYVQNPEGNDPDVNTPNTEEPDVSDIPTVPGKIGEKAQVSDVEITLGEVLDAGTLETEDDSSSKSQVVALVCDVTNNTDKTLTVNSFDFVVQYVDGEPLQITSGMRELLAAGQNITSAEQLNHDLEPGDTAKGYIALSLPEGWSSAVVYYSPAGAETVDSVAFELTSDMVQ